MTFQPILDAGESVRVAYWREQMDRSYELLNAMAQYPVADSGEGFASIPDAARSAGIEMLFSTSLLAGKFERIFFIREGLMTRLLGAGREMNECGWVMKIEEGYRTREMQMHLARQPSVFDMIVRTCQRECGGALPPLSLIARRANCLVANFPLVDTHLFGAAVDISIFRRDDGSEVSRGKPYLEMSEYTPMLSSFVSQEEHENRVLIKDIMERHDFVHYPGEFWHFNSGDVLYQTIRQTGQPGRYGPVHWDAESNTVMPFKDVSSPLTPPGELQQELGYALGRLQAENDGFGGRAS